MSEPDYSGWNLIPQAASSYEIHKTCQIENLGKRFEDLPKPFGVFDPAYRGRFVEVGSFNGPTYSNLWQFVKAGWQGVMIEPMPDNVASLRENLAALPSHNVTVVPVACDDHEGILPMFFEREGSRESKPGELTYPVNCLRLDTVLENAHWNLDWDILSIDTEAHEQPVLRGFTLAKWVPKIVLIETYGWQRQIIHDYFEPMYRTHYEDGLNTFFVRKDWAP